MRHLVGFAVDGVIGVEEVELAAVGQVGEDGTIAAALDAQLLLRVERELALDVAEPRARVWSRRACRRRCRRRGPASRRHRRRPRCRRDRQCPRGRYTNPGLVADVAESELRPGAGGAAGTVEMADTVSRVPRPRAHAARGRRIRAVMEGFSAGGIARANEPSLPEADEDSKEHCSPTAAGDRGGKGEEKGTGPVAFRSRRNDKRCRGGRRAGQGKT